MRAFISYVIIAVVLSLIGLADHSLSINLYRQLVKKGNRNARGYRVATFIGSFLLILAMVVVVFMYNLRIER